MVSDVDSHRVELTTNTRSSLGVVVGGEVGVESHDRNLTRFASHLDRRAPAVAAVGETSWMELHPWPTDFLQKKAGQGCPQCEMGRVDETEHGVRFFAGDISDGYLQQQGPTAGYCVVIFRGRHAGAPQELSPDEHAGFWSEVGLVARAIEDVYRPIHLNFQILGNQDPHVHVHIVPRHDPDPAPSLPLPAEAWAQSKRLTADEIATQVEALRSAIVSPARAALDCMVEIAHSSGLYDSTAEPKRTR